MMDVIIQKLSAPDFSPENYVQELTQRCVGSQELEQQRLRIQALAEETNTLLKKNVYRHYMQFIETAKEISHLEGEMYQLCHQLTEQRALLAAMTTASVRGEKGLQSNGIGDECDGNKEEEKEQKRRQQLIDIGEAVEGCVSLVDIPGRQLMYDGDLLELDPIDNTPLQRVHAYLLTDTFIIASWILNRRSPTRYKYEAGYELGSLAVVNVRDLKNAFKLLVFPDTRVFQCSNSQTKKEWLEQFEEAKKLLVSKEKVKREISVEPKSPARSDVLETSMNPFEEPEEIETPDETPEWLLEVAEDLDVFIAQRHFEQAYKLIEKSTEYLEKNKLSNDLVAEDLKRKLDLRVKTLTNVLTKELEVSPDKSQQGGLRAARRAVRLLNKLGKSTQACDLMLKLCSSLLKTQLKRVKLEGAAVKYVTRLATVFFSNLAEMVQEFQFKAFPNSPQCASVLIMWLNDEVNILMSHLIKQVLVKQTSLSTLSQCVIALHTQCSQLDGLGVDVKYLVDGQLRPGLTRALTDTRDKLIDAVKLRSGEDKWHPTNLNTKQQRDKLLSEFSNLPALQFESYITGDFWIGLSANTIAFARLYLSLIEDCLLLITPDLTHTIDQLLYDVFSAQLKHVGNSLNSERFRNERQFITINGKFLVDKLLKHCNELYEKKVGVRCKKLDQLKIDYSRYQVTITSYI
nr:PREDICTED: exocyst complex component 8 isoform X1 [Bemisia tabaci]